MKYSLLSTTAAAPPARAAGSDGSVYLAVQTVIAGEGESTYKFKDGL